MLKGSGLVDRFAVEIRQLFKQLAARHFNVGAASCSTKWSTGKAVYPKGEQSEEVQNIKQRKWEIVRTFGPLLTTTARRRRRSRQDDTTADVVVHVSEAGFKDLQSFSPSTSSVVAATVEADDIRQQLEAPRPSYSEGSVMKAISGGYQWRVITSKVVPSVSSTSKQPTQVVNVRPSAESVEGVRYSPVLKALRTFPMLKVDNVMPLAHQCQDWLRTHEAFVVRPSVSTILQQTMPLKSVQALEKWKVRLVEQLGMEGFQNYQAELLRVGRTLHQAIERFLSRKSLDEFQVDDSIVGYWRSLQTVLSDVSNVVLQEQPVEHPFLFYRGVLDCVANYRGVPMLIEWKTSQRPKPSVEDTFDNPLQAAAYVGALNFTEKLNFQVTNVAIVVAYSSGAPADVHLLDDKLTADYWDKWLMRFSKFSLLVETF